MLQTAAGVGVWDRQHATCHVKLLLCVLINTRLTAYVAAGPTEAGLALGNVMAAQSGRSAAAVMPSG